MIAVVSMIHITSDHRTRCCCLWPVWHELKCRKLICVSSQNWCKASSLHNREFWVVFSKVPSGLCCYCHPSSMSGNTAWGFEGHGHAAVVSTISLYTLRFPWSPWTFSQSWVWLWMVKELHFVQSCICLSDQQSNDIWHKVVNYDPSLFTKT